MSLDKLPRAQSFGISEFISTSLKDIKNGSDVFGGSSLELVFGCWMSPGDSFAFDFLIAGSLDAEGRVLRDTWVKDRFLSHD